jgi:hypothetical protein
LGERAASLGGGLGGDADGTDSMGGGMGGRMGGDADGTDSMGGGRDADGTDQSG